VTTVTEAEWLACTDPHPMLEFLRGKVRDRKLWLYAAAFFRRIQHGLHCAEYRHILHESKAADKLDRAIEVTERFADGEVSDEERAAAWCDWISAQENPPTDWSKMRAVVGGAAWDAAGVGCVASVLGDNQAATLLRDLFGNPFRPVTAHPGWLAWEDGAVVKLAQAIYDERAFDRLPILADALEEAGCTNAEILAHCRETGAHVRGCWVVDLILGKE
jgi:hypothetical protein